MTLIAKPCSRSLKVREEIQMDNTHPLNHVPLYWRSAPSEFNSESVRLRSLYIFLCASCLLTRKQSAQFRHKVDVFLSTANAASKCWSREARSEIKNCSLELLPRGEVPRLSSVRSRTFNTVRSAGKLFLKKASFPQALRKIFERLKDASDMIGSRARKSSADFRTIFWSVCLDLLLTFYRRPRVQI